MSSKRLTSWRERSCDFAILLYGYAPFSTPGQVQGDSYRRQTERKATATAETEHNKALAAREELRRTRRQKCDRWGLPPAVRPERKTPRRRPRHRQGRGLRVPAGRRR